MESHCGWSRQKFSLSMIVLFLLTSGMQPIHAVEVLSEGKKRAVVEMENTNQDPGEYNPSYPQESTSGSTSGQILIIGGAVALGVGALALGGGGGGGDDTPKCESDPVGPSIAGDTWQGILRLVDNGTQPVGATISQCGRDITITTTTTLEYGKNFVGSMGTNGDIKVHDQVTLQDWTTYYGQAKSNYIKIYDKVKNGTKLDSLELSR